jgi:hypothetical protein
MNNKKYLLNIFLVLLFFGISNKFLIAQETTSKKPIIATQKSKTPVKPLTKEQNSNIDKSLKNKTDILKPKNFNYPLRKAEEKPVNNNKNVKETTVDTDSAERLKQLNLTTKDVSSVFQLERNKIDRHFFSISNSSYIGNLDIDVSVESQKKSVKSIFNNSMNLNYSYAIFPFLSVGVSLDYFINSPNLTNQDKDLNIKISDQYLYLLTAKINIYKNNKFSFWVSPKVGGFTRNINLNDNGYNNIQAESDTFGLSGNKAGKVSLFTKDTSNEYQESGSYFSYQAQNIKDACIMSSQENVKYSKNIYVFIVDYIEGAEGLVKLEYNKPRIREIYSNKNSAPIIERNDRVEKDYYLYYNGTIRCLGTFVKKDEYSKFLQKQTFTTNLTSIAYGLDFVANYSVNNYLSVFFNLGYLSVLQSSYKQNIGDKNYYADSGAQIYPEQLKYKVTLKTAYYSNFNLGLMFQF